MDENWDDDVPQPTNVAPPAKRHEHPREFNNAPKRTNYEFDNSENSETMIVESRFMGLIIGKGGANIKSIQQKSNTNIKINENYSNPGTATVIIKGEKNCVESAKSLISNITNNRDSSSNRNNNRGTNFRDGNSDFNRDRSNYNNRGGQRNFNSEYSHSSSAFNRNDSTYNNRQNNYNNNYDYDEPEDDEEGQNNNDYGVFNKPKAGDYISKGKIDWRAISNDAKLKADEARKELPPIIKNFYREPEEIAQLSEEEVARMRFERNKISVSDLKNDTTRVIPKIISKFEHAFSDYPEILETVANAKFKTPSPIQCQAWPIIMSGYDLIGIAQTGTGKTLAFLLPALIHIEHQPVPRNQRVGPSCLILSPTRELAIQIHEEVLKFNYKNIRSCCVYGGASRSEQVGIIEQGVEIVIATPGRLNDLIDSGIISMKSVTFLVLDEADRMLDMGFEPDIRKIILLIREDRQTVMTTATWPISVSRIARMYQTEPFKVNVGSLNLQACESVTQNIEIIDQEDKMERLKFLLSQADDNEKILIFVGRKLTADHLSVELNLQRVCDGGIECLHGGREQSDRERVLAAFRSGSARILIATDLASRGLDIHDINVVINYDFPKHIEEYVHRIGRTGRAGRFGTSISFVTRENWGQAQSLIDILTESSKEIPHELVLMAERFKEKQAQREMERSSRFGGGGGNFQSTSGQRLCRSCGKSGHLSRDCNNR